MEGNCKCNYFVRLDSILQLVDTVLTRYLNLYFYKYQLHCSYREMKMWVALDLG